MEGLLAVVSRAAQELNYLVVVCANGCSDGTAALARQTPGVRVLELPDAGKAGALNAAEAEAGDVFPRLYVDADAEISLASLEALVGALRVDRPLAVRPRSERALGSCSFIVRASVLAPFYMPSSRAWMAEHLEGHAVYGTNRAGRARFDTFPELIADDAFFDRMFDLDQKLVVDDALVTVAPPTRLRPYFRMLVRIFRGNDELEAWLRRHRPDRLLVPASNGTHSFASMLQRKGSYLWGTFGWRRHYGREIVPVVVGSTIRSVARIVARRQGRSERAVAWR